MNMIFGDVAFDNLNIQGSAYFPDEFSQPDGHVSKENRFAVLADPYQMIFQIVDGMRGLAVVFHGTANLLKSSPEGEGFYPIPRRGQ
jgi:hypothetical protein